MIFKLEKNAKKTTTHGKSKSKTSKLKSTGSKINGKKWKVKMEKKGKTWICPFVFFLHLFCFLDFFSFYFVFFCFLPGKKQNKSNKKKIEKKQNKCTQNANGQVHFVPIFSLFDLFFVHLFSPLILLLCFLDFADLLFVFSFLCVCRVFFQVSRKLE